MSANDPEYNDPDSNISPYAHAARHLDEAEEWTDGMEGVTGEYVARVHALIGIGWALLAIARKR